MVFGQWRGEREILQVGKTDWVVQKERRQEHGEMYQMICKGEFTGEVGVETGASELYLFKNETVLFRGSCSLGS